MAEETKKQPRETQEELSSEELENASGGTVETVSQRFTLFKEDGTPLRAKVNTTLKEND